MCHGTGTIIASARSGEVVAPSENSGTVAGDVQPLRAVVVSPDRTEPPLALVESPPTRGRPCPTLHRRNCGPHDACRLGRRCGRCWPPARCSHDFATAQIIVENSLESCLDHHSPVWTLEEDLRIWGPPGRLPEPGALAVAADSRDNIYILDYVTQEIQVFDSDGRLPADARRTGGRAGGVPGCAGTRHRRGRHRCGWRISGRRAIRSSHRTVSFIEYAESVGASAAGVHDHGALHDCGGRQLYGVVDAFSEGGEERRPESDIDLIHFHPVRVSPDTERSRTRCRTWSSSQRMADHTIAGHPAAGSMLGPGNSRGPWVATTMSGSRTAESTGCPQAVRSPVTQPWSFTLEGIRPADSRRSRPRRGARHIRTPPRPRVDGETTCEPCRSTEAGHCRNIFVDGAGHVFVLPETSKADVGHGHRRIPRRRGVPGAGRGSGGGQISTHTKAYATADYILFAGEDDAGTPYVTRLRIQR